MTDLFAFIQDIGGGLSYWVPTLCLILGAGTIFGGLLMMLDAGQRNDTSVTSLGKIVGVMTIGALLLAPAAFVNMVSTTAGSTHLASIGGAERDRAEVPSADELEDKTITQIVQAVMAPMTPFFDGYGMLFVILAGMRFKARLQGASHVSLGSCAAIFFGAIAVIHSEEIATWLVKGLKLE